MSNNSFLHSFILWFLSLYRFRWVVSVQLVRVLFLDRWTIGFLLIPRLYKWQFETKPKWMKSKRRISIAHALTKMKIWLYFHIWLENRFDWLTYLGYHPAYDIWSNNASWKKIKSKMSDWAIIVHVHVHGLPNDETPLMTAMIGPE